MLPQSLDLTYRQIFGLDFINITTSTLFFTDDVNILGNLNILGNCNMYNNSSINSNLISNNITANSILSCNTTIYVSTNTTINTNLNIVSNLNSNIVVCNNNITLNTNICVKNLAIMNNLSTNNLYINTNAILKNTATVNSSLLISGTIMCNDLNVSNNLNISNNSIIKNITILSNLNIFKSLIINNNCTINSLLYSGKIITYNNSTFISNLYINNVTGNTINVSNNGIFSTLNISGDCYTNSLSIKSLNGLLQDYPDNDSAIANNIPLWGLYKTGGIIKIRINKIDTIIILTGTSIINLYINDIFIDPGAYIPNNTNSYILNTIGSVNTQYQSSYIRYYNAVDINNNIICSISRTINIYNYPIIVSIVLYNNNIIITNSGIYNIMTYKITSNNLDIIPETQITNTTINISSFIPNNIQYLITVYLKNINEKILTTNTLFFII